MDLPKTIAPSPTQGRANLSGGNHAPFSDQLLEKARVNVDTALKDLESRLSGLSTAEVEARIKRDGLNEIGREIRPSPLMRLWDNVKNPLVILLTALGVLSYLTGDGRATIVIFVMVLLGVVLRYFQEMRADNAAEKLKAMVNTTATSDIELRRARLNGNYDLQVGDTVLLTERGEKFGSIKLVGGKLIQTLKVSGAQHEIPPVKGSACLQKPDEQASHDCHECHAYKR